MLVLGVCLCGVGHTMTTSRIHHGAHFGMLLTGNDHIIRQNHFFDLVYAGADAGVNTHSNPHNDPNPNAYSEVRSILGETGRTVVS